MAVPSGNSSLSKDASMYYFNGIISSISESDGFTAWAGSAPCRVHLAAPGVASYAVEATK